MNRTAIALSGLVALFAACGGSSGGGTGFGSSSRMEIIEASNGFGKLLPHTINELDSQGQPTGGVLEITRMQDLENVTLTNPIKSPVQWNPSAILPDSAAGNHFIYVRFSQAIDITSVIDPSTSASVNAFLTGSIQVVEIDPLSGASTQIEGRPFIGGMTAGAGGTLATWVVNEGGTPAGKPIAVDIGGVGFPGTEQAIGFSGSNELVLPNTFVYVADSDDDLSTHETFPSGVQIQMRITKGVLGEGGRALQDEGVASSTVGGDGVNPEVLVAGAMQTPVIIPGNGDIDVDPTTTIEVFFTEPIQILSVGELDDGTPPQLSAAIQLQFGPDTGKVDVPFTVAPFSVFDLTRLELTPSYAFPGTGPSLPGVSCAEFGMVDVIVNPGQFEDLTTNINTFSPSTFFETGQGAGLVNAPVTPDTIYLARGGSNPGISVIDLNGFGQGCGNPAYDPQQPIKKGNSNFPNNPNVKIQGSLMTPPLSNGTCTFDGGSEGVFSLAKDSALNDLLITQPVIESVGDMSLGRPLDASFNNSPFGCQAGGGNLCAQTGLKIVTIATAGASTLLPPTVNASLFTIKTEFGTANLASWAPHPNPPPLIFPPICQSPLIGAIEPTSIITQGNIITGTAGLNNLLVPGSLPLGNPTLNIPPDGLIVSEQNGFFQGPSPPQSNIAACVTYMMRQQVGQFLYMVDRSAGEIVVLNSNRFTVIDRIRTSDPTSLAMSPNLDLLAVTNQGSDQVSFIDINPGSGTFHQIISSTNVGNGPLGIAWTPDNEDILVCNQLENTISIISAFDLKVRKVIQNQLRSPFELTITPRQNGFGFQRGVYYAYVMNGDGTVALFESGPDGLNGWGFDDVVGSIPFTFSRPKAIQADPTSLNSQFYILHENPLDLNGNATGLKGGAVSLCGMSSGTIGQIQLDPGNFANPRIRDIQYSIFGAIEEGTNGLTGIPIDIAFDNMKNRTALTNVSSPFSASAPRSINGKAIVKNNNGIQTTSSPQFIFLAVPNSREGPGVVDVIGVTSLKRFDTDIFLSGVQSIQAPNVTKVVDYLRQ